MTTEIKTKERPILFQGDMVRAVLEGRKTQTRRVIKRVDHCNGDILQHEDFEDEFFQWIDGEATSSFHCPYGAPGDRLWVRETWADVNTENGPAIAYKADGGIRDWQDFSTTFGPDYGAGPSMDYDAYPGNYCMWWSDLLNEEPGHSWKPSIHMYRWASRIDLRVTDVRVERVQDASDGDAVSEGFDSAPNYLGVLSKGERARHWFRELWDSINKDRGFGWDVNPWVWVVEFATVSQ